MEFSLTAPAFFALLMAFFMIGLWLWASFALQHAVELAARCASVSTATCNSVSAIQSYAATKTLGFPVAPASFFYSEPSCGKQVSVDFSAFNGLRSFGFPAVSIHAQACFP